MPITTTLNAIRRYKPCKYGWENLLNHLGKAKADGDPLLISTILASNGFDDAIWCLRAVDNKQAIVEFAQCCADSVKDLKNHLSYAAVAAASACAADADASAYAAASAASAASAYAATAAAASAYAAAAAAAGYAAGYDARDAERKKQAQFLIEIFG